MAVKPILFNTGMVRALLDGRKTVTRRVVKPQHLCVLDSQYHQEHPETPDKVLLEKLCQPPYQPDDILYVRETWQEKRGGGYLYKVDTVNSFDLFVTPDGRVVSEIPWRPSIHMPKEAARIFLRVTDVRVERLLDPFFTNKAAIFVLQNEGIDIGEHCRQCINHYGSPCCIDHEEDDECGILDDIRGDFSERWDAAIKPADRALYGWAANPWVWVIEFKRISKEEAQ